MLLTGYINPSWLMFRWYLGVFEGLDSGGLENATAKIHYRGKTQLTVLATEQTRLLSMK